MSPPIQDKDSQKTEGNTEDKTCLDHTTQEPGKCPTETPQQQATECTQKE